MIARRISVAVLATFLVLQGLAHAQAAEQTQPSTLLDLLERVKEGSKIEEQENLRREQEFRAAKADQKRLLEQALAAEAVEHERAGKLELEFEANENAIPELEETLRNRLGTLGEVFGVVRQVAGDTRSNVETSIISAQIPGRERFLSDLAQSRELPSIDDLRKLWFSLQQEMTEQGRVVSFPATVIKVGGAESEEQVTRIGSFNTVSDGRYLQFLPESGKLAELGRQPASRYLNTLSDFEKATAGVQRVAIDPTRGTILSMLIQAPNFEERVRQGGVVGYVTIALGTFGFLLAIYRLVSLALAGRRIRAQVDTDAIDTGNALGRILSVYKSNQATDVETLELRLDEAILRETSGLQKGTTLVKVLSVVAPLLGLLGTVTGMIITFQQITLFGTGDPKLMAGGISQALVTTVIGLVVAIPLTLLHSILSDRSKSLIQILEEHSVGLVAEQAESLAGKAA